MDDLIIIGTGPAGLTASIYASCFHLSHHLIGSSLGGQMLLAPDILNYPGFVEISGRELTSRMVEQVRARGGIIVEDLIVKIAKENDSFIVEGKKGASFVAKTVILATGTERKKLNVPGEVTYAGRGVHYCATCDRQDYEGKVVAVVGGANAASQAAVQLAQAASKVFLFHRGVQLTCDPEWQYQMQKQPNIQVLYNTKVVKILGDGKNVTGVDLLVDEREKHLELEKIFIEIGGVPGTALVAPLGVTVDKGGFIQVNENLETNVKGIFAAGDLVSFGLSIEQISTAVGLGAKAASSVFTYLKKTPAPSVWGKGLIKT